jgi:hypothetical protein
VESPRITQITRISRRKKKKKPGKKDTRPPKGEIPNYKSQITNNKAPFGQLKTINN